MNTNKAKRLLKRSRIVAGIMIMEVLVIVFIIGILAVLILPRMLVRPEPTITIEALNYLEVIRKAQEAAAQRYGNYLSANSGNVDGATPSDRRWRQLGLGPLPKTSNFIYSCTAGSTGNTPAARAPAGTAGTCTASRLGLATTPKGSGTITMGISNGYIYSCDGAKYVLRGTSGQQDATCI